MEREITIYHSPDADDAFMFYGLVGGGVSVPGYRFSSELCDIESLNQQARKGALDATAVSVHAFSYLADQYSILMHGASMGEKSYGPRLVAKQGATLKNRVRLALPGELTSATLAMKLYLREQEIQAEVSQLHFEEIEDAVLSGDFDAGLLIHEGQLTHQEKGLTSILDLGTWWWERTELPLPLGVNIVRRNFTAADKQAVARVLLNSIEFSMQHRSKATDHALSYGRGLSAEMADEFVRMYVNERTLDLGEEGQRSIRTFLQCGAEAGLCPPVGEIEFVAAR